MPDAVSCPTPQELTAFGLGKLPQQTAAAIAAHLESCAKCVKAVADVTPDSFLEKVRAAGPAGSSFPPSLAQPGNAPKSGERPAVPIVPCPDVPPELARHPKYLILRELGRGGMGVVYQARQTVMDRPVVIKVINRALLDRPESLERFRREVQAAAQLSHPNIVTAYDAEQAGELHMLVMEFVPGQSLAEVLQKRGPLPVAYACHFARQVALGLQHAHERGMVHRDIKPQNLILSLKNQIKILDFGLAKVVSERNTEKGLTESGAYMGTPDYCAPEQAEDASKADIRADLYSLGCTLYCLLAGHPPFHEDTVFKTFLAHREKQPRPLLELRSDVPAELWQVVKRLLAKDPAQRDQKPIEVVQALTPFVKPGAKTEPKSGSMPVRKVDPPVKATRIDADTNQVKKVLREVPGKAMPKKALAKEDTSPFANLTDAVVAPKNVAQARNALEQLLPAWLKRLGRLAVAAVVFVALILTAAIIIKIKDKVQTPGSDTGKVMSSKAGTGEPEPPPTEEAKKHEEKVETQRKNDVAPPPLGPPSLAPLMPPKPQALEAPVAKKDDLGDQHSQPKADPGKQDDAETLTKRGLDLLNKGDVEGAIVEFRRAIQLNKYHHGAHCNLGNALLQKGYIEEAISECRRAIELKEKNGKDCPAAHDNLGSALWEKGDSEGAIAAHHQAIALEPDFAEAYSHLGAALSCQEKHAEAEAAFQRAIALKPDSAGVYTILGGTRYRQGKYAEAEAALRKAIALKPDSALAYNNLGAALMSQGKYAEAEAAVRKVIALKPDNAVAYNNLGKALRSQGKHAEAEAAFRKARDLKPK